MRRPSGNDFRSGSVPFGPASFWCFRVLSGTVAGEAVSSAASLVWLVCAGDSGVFQPPGGAPLLQSDNKPVYSRVLIRPFCFSVWTNVVARHLTYFTVVSRVGPFSANGAKGTHFYF